ncbi:cytochrome P450 3A29-like [Saccoglossus kowalevskii]
MTLCLFYIYSTWTFSTLKKMGIPGPSPWPLFGNMLQYREGIQYKDLEWIKKYGKVYGAYEGRTPVITFADPEICKQICVKHFGSFVNRRVLPLKSRPLDSGLTVLLDDHWRGARNTLTPSFSGAKMKLMSPLINRCATELVNNLKNHCDSEKPVEIKEMFGSFVIDSIGSAGFGLDVNSQSQPDHPFVVNIKKAFKFSLFSPVVLIVLFFPFLVPILNYFDVAFIPRKILNFFVQVTDEAIQMRKSTADSNQRIDFLQLMMNAHDVYEKYMKNKEYEEDKHEGENKVEFVKDDPSSSMKIHKGFTRDEIVGQSLLFFFAGYETTSTLLAFVCYNLATNPEVQDTLHKEIDNVMLSYEEVGYDAVSDMTYLDMVVSETLRKYPPATRFDRKCNKDVNINGIKIPSGMTVVGSIYGIHHDPDIYPDPDKFIPERFSKEEKAKRHPYAWIPFGAGPRNCIGMRFALMEAKIGLVRALQKFTFEPCAETQIPPELGKMGFLSPPNGIILRIKSRQ